MLLACVAVSALWAGFAIRRWAWDITVPIRFVSDITRGYGWGLAASGDEGYLNLYEKMAGQQSDWPLWLDYAPLRLGVMTLWARHNRLTRPDYAVWQPTYAFNRPVLWFNTAMELLGAAAAFLIVRRWATVCSRSPRRPFVGWPSGLAAALLLWFNPAMILSAHGWPTWDMWIVPIYLLAVLAAVYDRWLVAGLVLGAGVMFKGQQFVGLPVFLAWTILNGRFASALRLGCGFVIAFAAVASPWLVTFVPAGELARWHEANPHAPSSPQVPPFLLARQWNLPALLWTIGVAGSAAALPQLWRLPRGAWRSAGIALTGILSLWPAVYRPEWKPVAFLIVGAGVLVLSARLAMRRGDRLILVLAAISVALLAGIVFFGASTAWWNCGIAFGTRHWRVMVMGVTDNLPGLLQHRFGWDRVDETMFTTPGWLSRFGLPAGTTLSVQRAMQSLFILTLLPCLWAVARHARRRDPRLLVAITAPWLMFFCFPCQIHERYLLYAAAVGVVMIGQSVGMGLLSVVLTVITWVQTIHVMLNAAGPEGRDSFGRVLHASQPDLLTPQAGQTLHRIVEHTFPDLAWAVLLAAAFVLYRAVTATRRQKDTDVDQAPATTISD